MATLSLLLKGRVGGSSPRRRHSANNYNRRSACGDCSGATPQDRLSRFFFLSVLLLGCSGVTLGIFLLSNGTSSSGSGGATSEALDGSGSDVGGGSAVLLEEGKRSPHTAQVGSSSSSRPPPQERQQQQQQQQLPSLAGRHGVIRQDRGNSLASAGGGGTEQEEGVVLNSNGMSRGAGSGVGGAGLGDRDSPNDAKLTLEQAVSNQVR